MSYCSPSVNIKDHYTCFEYDELKQILESDIDLTYAIPKIELVAKYDWQKNINRYQELFF